MIPPIPASEIVHAEPIWCRLRDPRDFERDGLNAFTARQMADRDCNMESEFVLAGQNWLISGIGLAPDTPHDFSSFRDLCTLAPNANVSLIIPGREYEARCPLGFFWNDGEYILRPVYRFTTPVVLESKTMYRLRVSFDTPGTSADCLTRVRALFITRAATSVIRASLIRTIERLL